MKVENHSEILSKLIKRRKPDLPEHFFQFFQDSLTNRVSEKNEQDGFDLPEIKKPKVPERFFENFYSGLKGEIEHESVFSDLKITKSNRPDVPENFETVFQNELMEKIRKKSSTGKILKITFWSATVTVAAGLALLFTLNTESPASEQISDTQTSSEITEEESLDAYVAYLDEQELVDYIIENNIDMGQAETESNEIYDYVSDDIEDIYLDL